jgi:hypothetical protein
MPSGSRRSKLANCVSPHEDSGGTGNRSVMTTFADARVSAVKYSGKRGNPHEATGRAVPAWAANAAHIQSSTRGKNFWKSAGVIGPALTLPWGRQMSSEIGTTQRGLISCVIS